MVRSIDQVQLVHLLAMHSGINKVLFRITMELWKCWSSFRKVARKAGIGMLTLN